MSRAATSTGSTASCDGGAPRLGKGRGAGHTSPHHLTARNYRLHCRGPDAEPRRAQRHVRRSVPDALTALSRLITSLHDDRGNVTIEGLHSGKPYGIGFSEADIRRFASVRPSVSLMGSGTLAHRLWGRPAVAVLGIDAPSTTDAANKLVPVARAKISVRLAPGDDTARARTAIKEHFLSRARAPWGAEVAVTFVNEGNPHLIDASGGAFEAFRAACAHTWGCSPSKRAAAARFPWWPRWPTPSRVRNCCSPG